MAMPAQPGTAQFLPNMAQSIPCKAMDTWMLHQDRLDSKQQNDVSLSYNHSNYADFFFS